MLSLVVIEIVPQASTRAAWRDATAGATVGVAIVPGLSAALGV